MKEALGARVAEGGLELHPDKTQIGYGQDAARRGEYPPTKVDCLGDPFQARRSKNRGGKSFLNFRPALSHSAAKALRKKTRRWGLHRRSDKSLADLSRRFNPLLRGGVNDYGRVYKSALYPTLHPLDRILVRWARRQYKRLRRHRRRAEHGRGRIARKEPQLVVHWQLGVRPTAG